MSSPREAISPKLLAVLRQLSAAPLLANFYLVGGTALALQLGHRQSVDIDLFTHTPFDSQPISDWIIREMGATETETATNLVRCFIQGIKVDILAHQYPLVDPAVTVNSIRVAGLRDIAAMKVNAVTNRGAKKDFWDIAVLLAGFTLPEILDLYRRKYGTANTWMAVKSLCYFQDADAENVPILDLSGMTWEQVKAKIRNACAALLPK